MKKYLGFEYNEAGKLEESYAYTISTEYAEMIENMILYYDRHGIGNMIENHPQFVNQDFNKILETLKNIMEV